MLTALKNSLSDSYSNKMLAECLEELINPCNVLVIDPITSKYSFGHFRYQEHLVSEELKTNRNISLSEISIVDRWIGAMCLYAQETDISYLFEEIYNKYGNIKRAKTCLKAMIEASPKIRRGSLRDLLVEYERSDEFDSAVLNDDYH